MHVRGAVNNGASEVEIREALLQAACYCGMPAGIEGFRVAERVLGEIKAEKEKEQESTGSGQANLNVVVEPEAKDEPQVEGGQRLNPS